MEVAEAADEAPTTTRTSQSSPTSLPSEQKSTPAASTASANRSSPAGDGVLKSTNGSEARLQGVTKGPDISVDGGNGGPGADGNGGGGVGGGGFASLARKLTSKGKGET